MPDVPFSQLVMQSHTGLTQRNNEVHRNIRDLNEIHIQGEISDADYQAWLMYYNIAARSVNASFGIIAEAIKANFDKFKNYVGLLRAGIA